MRKTFVHRSHIVDVEISGKSEVSISMSNDNYHSFEFSDEDAALKWVEKNFLRGPYLTEYIELPLI